MLKGNLLSFPMLSDRQTLIHHFLESSAQTHPDKIALIHEDVRATYAEINARANQLAHWLIDQGITEGDRVALIFENCLEYVISYYGALKAAAVAAPLSSDLKPDGLKHLLGDLEPKAVIASSRFERLLRATDLSPFNIRAIILEAPKLNWSYPTCPVFTWEEIFGNENHSNPHKPIEDSALASIIYTSGSTGKPKGVMLSHRNIVSNTHSICHYLHLSENDIQMVVLPFFYVMGKSLLNTHFAVGGTVVINNKFAYPASVIKQMGEERITGFSGVPSTYAYLLHRSPLANYRDKLPSLRYCSQAGGHMSGQIKEELRRVLPSHTRIFIMYGATEASI
jgi:long-chain acyl-CoA synthetase